MSPTFLAVEIVNRLIILSRILNIRNANVVRSILNNYRCVTVCSKFRMIEVQWSKVIFVASGQLALFLISPSSDSDIILTTGKRLEEM